MYLVVAVQVDPLTVCRDLVVKPILPAGVSTTRRISLHTQHLHLLSEQVPESNEHADVIASNRSPKIKAAFVSQPSFLLLLKIFPVMLSAMG